MTQYALREKSPRSEFFWSVFSRIRRISVRMRENTDQKNSEYEHFLRSDDVCWNIRQIFHAFLFSIRNYSPEVSNIQRCEAELNIILPRVNSFDIKQKKAWSICSIICHQHQTRSGKIKANKTQQTSVKTEVFFLKTALQHI